MRLFLYWHGEILRIKLKFARIFLIPDHASHLIR
jgi:hypothetical protein